MVISLLVASMIVLFSHHFDFIFLIARKHWRPEPAASKGASKTTRRARYS